MLAKTLPAIEPLSHAVWLRLIVERLLEVLREDMADPLHESLTLSAVLLDLFELAGVALPDALREAW